VEPTNIRFGGGSAVTVLHPLVAAGVLVAIVLIFVLPRKYVVGPLLVTWFLVPFGQVVVVNGVHFTVYRILILAGLARLLMLKLSSDPPRLAGGFNSIDWAFTLCIVLAAVAFCLTWMETQAVIKKLGSLIDALGGYFLVRFLIQDREDVRCVVRVLVYLDIIVAACMVSEQIFHLNIFASLGETIGTPSVRGGSIRSQGPFSVYITAGVFGATLVPVLFWMWKDGISKVLAITGLVASTLIVVTSFSSTPLLAYAAGIGALCLWPIRNQMRPLRWLLVVVLVVLHLVMKAPVWALISRVDLTGASSGFHRYMLIDNFIRHVGDWWLLGAKDYNTWGFDMWDTSNQYIEYGVTGGLVSLVCFILVISRSFGKLGNARKWVAENLKEEWLLWCMGAALLAHVVAYFGISYFDQVQAAWYVLLAIICAAVAEASNVTEAQTERAFAPEIRPEYELARAVQSI
jgi:hypothetical protein